MLAPFEPEPLLYGLTNATFLVIGNAWKIIREKNYELFGNYELVHNEIQKLEIEDNEFSLVEDLKLGFQFEKNLSSINQRWLVYVYPVDKKQIFDELRNKINGPPVKTNSLLIEAFIKQYNFQYNDFTGMFKFLDLDPFRRSIYLAGKNNE